MDYLRGRIDLMSGVHQALLSSISSSGYTVGTGAKTDGTSGNYLRRAVSGAITTFTLSAWIKRDALAVNTYFFAITDSSGGSETSFAFNSSNQFQILNNHLGGTLTSTETFTDTTSYHHVVISCSSGTVTIYVDGVALTMSGSTIEPFTSGDYAHFGSYSTVSNWFDGGYAEAHFIDGTAKAASDFGETRGGSWKPIEYAGSYGTDGFYLSDDFYIGDDVSGNGNDLTKTGTITQESISPPIG